MKQDDRERETQRVRAIVMRFSPSATEEQIQKLVDLNLQIAESRRTAVVAVQAEIDIAIGAHVIGTDFGIREATGFGYAEQISRNHWEAYHNGMWATVETRPSDTEGVVQIVSIKVRR